MERFAEIVFNGSKDQCSNVGSGNRVKSVYFQPPNADSAVSRGHSTL